MTIAILMPVYNDEEALRGTLRSIASRADDLDGVTVFVVDDGSEPPIDPARLPRAPSGFAIVFARHAVNLGQGAALETARQLALLPVHPPYAAYVTMDADGQHRIEDAIAVAAAVGNGADVAFGNRFLGASNVPPVRRILLRAARLFEWALTGLRLADAHNGLRAFSRRALERIAIRQNRMAHATEIKQRVSRAGPLSIVEVPVSLRYTRETLAKGQPSSGAVVIVRDLVLHYLFGEPE